MDRGRLLPVVLSFLIILNLPLFETGASDGEVRGGIVEPGRENEVTVNEIEIVAPPEYLKNGRYGNGLYPIAVNFTLAHQIMNVNITLNVSHGLGFEVNVNALGTLAAGDYEPIANKLFDFMDPGLYNINATVTGWLSGTGNVTEYKVVEDINFTTVIEFTIDINIDAPEVDGIYGKNLMLIECTVNNTGNALVFDTNVSLAIKNITDDTPEDILENWEILDPLPPEMESDLVLFFWMPSKEGVTSNYEINVTAKNATLNHMNSNTLQVQVTNITDLHLVSMVVEPPQIYPTGSLLVNVLLNNTGNARGTGDVRLLIYPEGQPGNVVIDETGTSGLISPEQGGSGRQNENEISFLGLLINDPGNYTVEARLLGTPEVIFGDLSVIGVHIRKPELFNTTFTPEYPVPEGTEITFSVFYIYWGDLQGDVILFIDDEPFAMINSSDNWSTGVKFTYTWVTKGLGIHYYYFFAESVLGVNTTLLNATDEPFSFEVTERTHGWFYGKIVDSEGNNVSGAELVIYSTKLNGTGVTVLDEYYNTTTDASGCYAKRLPFSEYNYVIRVNEEWLEKNGYIDAEPRSSIFYVDSDRPTAIINFTFEKKLKTTCIKGRVRDMDTQLSILHARITVVVFSDVLSQEKMILDGIKLTVNVTTRTWMNLTDVTDWEGAYTITGVPCSVPDPGDLAVTGTKRYLPCIEDIPMEAVPGRWEVKAHKDGYVDRIENLEFDIAETTWWNISIGYPREPDTYRITGRVSPPQTVVTLDGTEVDIDPLTSSFSILNLTNGTYYMTFSAESYIPKYMNVTIDGSDVDLGNIHLYLDDVGVEEKKYHVRIGPLMDANGDAVHGVQISFTFGGITYVSITGSDGTATFELPVKQIPEGTVITAGDDRIIWTWGADYPEDFDVGGGDDTSNPPSSGNGGGGNALLIISVIIIIFIVLTVTFLVIKYIRGEEEIASNEKFRYHHGDAVDTTKRSRDMDLLSRFHCYNCGEIIAHDRTKCRRCGAAFENDEPVFSVTESELSGRI